MGRFIRGDIISAELWDNAHDTVERRPALILSQNSFGDYTILPITSVNHPDTVKINRSDLEGQFDQRLTQSYIKYESILTITRNRTVKKLNSVTQEMLEKIKIKIIDYLFN